MKQGNRGVEPVRNFKAKYSPSSPDNRKTVESKGEENDQMGCGDLIERPSAGNRARDKGITGGEKKLITSKAEVGREELKAAAGAGTH